MQQNLICPKLERMADWMDELERLGELRDKGLITDEEYEAERVKIIPMTPSTPSEDLTTSQENTLEEIQAPRDPQETKYPQEQMKPLGESQKEIAGDTKSTASMTHARKKKRGEVAKIYTILTFFALLISLPIWIFFDLNPKDDLETMKESEFGIGNGLYVVLEQPNGLVPIEAEIMIDSVGEEILAGYIYPGEYQASRLADDTENDQRCFWHLISDFVREESRGFTYSKSGKSWNYILERQGGTTKYRETTVVTITSTDVGFMSSGCTNWELIGTSTQP